MRVSSLSKFHPAHWLATTVTVRTWLIAFVLSVVDELGRMQAGSNVDATRSAGKPEEGGGAVNYRALFPRGYGPCRW